MSEYLLAFQNISKRFPGVLALNDVSFPVRRGEIHCIIGENGAGKSTLIKILSGALSMDSGRILFEDEPVSIDSSAAAKRLGIGTVYQEMSLVPSLNAVDNIFLGSEQTRGAALDRQSMKRRTREALEQLNVSVDLAAPVRQLSTAQQQMIEIARNLVFERKLIIMDEPTSSLSQRDVAELFRVIRLMKQGGVTIIYISHKMEELLEISDRLTIMRDGCCVDTVLMGETTIDRIIKLMVGRDFDIHRRPVERALDGEPVLEVRGMSDPAGRVKRASFSLPKGIILGFAGLVGAGRTELMRMVFGASPMLSGELMLKGERQPKPSTERSVARGLCYLSEDRKHEAVLLSLPIRHNISLANLSRVCRGYVIEKGAEAAAADAEGERVRIVASSMMMRAVNLSGGNQQKVAVAKWIFSNCDILIFDEPTRGIDVGARSEIYDLMNGLCDAGKSIILVSSDLTEILSMCNRVVTMHEGRITGSMDNDGTLTQEAVMKSMLGGA